MEPLHVVMPDGNIRKFNSVTPALDSALRSGGTAVELSGSNIVHQYTQRQFMGGWLLDNCPINVIMGMGWLPGQQEALAQAGITCSHSASTGAQEYIPPTPNVTASGRCPPNFLDVGDEYNAACVPDTGGQHHVVSNAPMPLADDQGTAVTTSTQTSVTPHTYTGGQSYNGGGGGVPSFAPSGGDGGDGGEGAGIGLMPLLIGAAVLFALTRN